MVKIIVVCLLLALGLWGCDDGGSRCSSGTEVTEECPVEGLVQSCRHYRCNGDQPLGDFRILTRDCEMIDCFTMECGIIDERFASGIFSVDGIIEPAIFTGVATVEGQEGLEYECTLTVP